MVLKKIILIPTQGLANRLRIITSTKIYINYTQNLTDLHINWIPELCCQCNFNDIFNENANEFELKQLLNYKYIFEENKHTNDILQTLDDNIEVLVIKGGHSFKHPNMSIEDFIYEKHKIYNTFKFNQNILKIIEKLKKDVPTNYIGLHIRRFNNEFEKKDNEKSNQFNQFNCNYSYYTKIIDNLKVNTKIFLCTNCEKTKNIFLEKYKNKIFSFNLDNYSRKNINGILYSLIDFLILNESDFIIGTHYSSFSDESCFKYLIPKLCVTDQPKQLTYHCYGYNYEKNVFLYNKKKIEKFIDL